MIVCKICHNQCDDTDFFCRKCGTPLMDDQAIDQAIEQLEKRYYWNRRRKRKLITIVSTIAVLFVIGSAAIGISAKMQYDIRHGDSTINSTILTQAVEVFFYKTHIAGNERFINNDKNLTLAAATELSGGEIITLAEDNDYKFQTEFQGWMRPEDYAAMINIKAGTFELDSRELSSYRTKGALSTMMGVLNVSNATNVKEAFYKIATNDIVDFEYINEQVIAVIKNDEGDLYFVYGFKKEAESSTMFVFEVYSERSIESGFLNEYAERELGRSINEVWSGITGRNL